MADSQDTTTAPGGKSVGAAIAHIPIRPDPLPNNPRHEWVFACVDGMPPARQKRLVMMARSSEVGFLSDADAETILDALGLAGT